MGIGFTGISFPFRFNNRGGIAMSTTSEYDISHIVESINFILKTQRYDRFMEHECYSDVDTQLFKPLDTVIQSLIRFEIFEAIRKNEPRIQVREQDITFTEVDRKLYAEIKFRVISYSPNSMFQAKFELL